MTEHHVFQALLITTVAGLSTTIGSVLGFLMKRPSPVFLAFTLGFSAGVMIFVSFIELLPTALHAPGLGATAAYSAFFSGMAVYFLIDLLVPHDYIGHHEPDSACILSRGESQGSTMQRTSLLVMVGITIHNFPEGIGTFVSGMQDIGLGIALGTAIAIHNIPEGLAISAPVFFATGSRKKAFLWSFYSGLSEVIGGVIAAAVLLPFISDRIMGLSLAAVAGIMVAISLDELMPMAKSMDAEHAPILGVMVGMIVMLLSLMLLK